MEEAKRFLRYVIPGQVFLLELLAIFVVSGVVSVVQLKGVLGTLTEKALESALVILVTSGGLGYLFSAIHHMLTREFFPFVSKKWKWHWTAAMFVDYSELLSVAQTRGLLIQDPNGVDLSNKTFSPECAWRVTSAVWHGGKDSTSVLGLATDRCESLADIMHGAGATFVATAAAVIVALALKIRAAFLSPHQIEVVTASNVVLLIFGALLIWFHRRNLIATTKHCQGVVEICFLQHLDSPEKLKVHPKLKVTVLKPEFW